MPTNSNTYVRVQNLKRERNINACDSEVFFHPQALKRRQYQKYTSAGSECDIFGSFTTKVRSDRVNEIEEEEEDAAEKWGALAFTKPPAKPYQDGYSISSAE